MIVRSPVRSPVRSVVGSATGLDSGGATPSPAIAAPSITSPASAATDVAETPTITSSAFAVTLGGSDTHAVSDWQIATDAAFASIVVQSLDDASNLESWTVPSGQLSTSTVYYVRARYTGSTYGASAWSSAISFTTAASFSTDVKALSLYYIAGGTDRSTVTDTSGEITAVTNEGTASGDTFTDAALYFGTGPTLQSSNGIYYFESNPTNDGRLQTTRTASALTADLFLVTRIPPGSDGSEVLVAGDPSIVAESGSGISIGTIGGAVTATVDQGSDITLRSELWIALVDRAWHVVRIKSGNWAAVTGMIHASGGTNMLVDTAAVAIIASSTVASSEAGIEAHFNAIADGLNGV